MFEPVRELHLNEFPPVDPSDDNVAFKDCLIPLLPMGDIVSVAFDFDRVVLVFEDGKNGSRPNRAIGLCHFLVSEEPLDLLDQLTFRICPNGPDELVVVCHRGGGQ